MFRRFFAYLKNRATCLFKGHDWRVAGKGHEDSAYPFTYSVCRRCDKDSRPDWAHEDEFWCSLTGQHAEVFGPKDWSPRWRNPR